MISSLEALRIFASSGYLFWMRFAMRDNASDNCHIRMIGSAIEFTSHTLKSECDPVSTGASDEAEDILNRLLVFFSIEDSVLSAIEDISQN